MRINGIRRTTVVLLALLAGGCAHGPEVPPVLSLDGRACATHFDLVTARLLQAAEPATVTVDVNTPCWQSEDGAKSTYLAFRLPTSPDPYLVTVTSAPQGKNLLPPRLFVLDFNGNVLRQQPRDKFLSHGALLAASMRIYPGDYALIVASDPASIGAQTSQIIATTQATTATVGIVTTTYYSGNEATVSSVSTHNGIVTVAVKPMPKTE